MTRRQQGVPSSDVGLIWLLGSLFLVLARARNLAILEALIGRIFLVTLIARLVSVRGADELAGAP